MAGDKINKNKTGAAHWLLNMGRKIAFADYERTETLQDILTRKPGLPSAGQVEAMILKRSETIKLWNNVVPLCFGFIPVCLLWAIPLFKESLSSFQIGAIIAMIMLTVGCYLLTFYNDSIRFRSNLAYVKQQLLAALSKESPIPMEQDARVIAMPIPKGSIPLFLLSELIKKEAGFSNIFNAPVEEIMPFCKKMFGFDEKNFKKMLSQYRRPQDIVLDRENARTTHANYLDLAVQYYNAIGEPSLAQQAISLQAYLNNTTLRSERKMK